jgi:hypothetical protein
MSRARCRFPPIVRRSTRQQPQPFAAARGESVPATVPEPVSAPHLFRMWSTQLGNDALFHEVREEVLDMGQ